MLSILNTDTDRYFYHQSTFVVTDAVIDKREIGNGVSLYYYFNNKFEYPLGFVWGVDLGTSIESKRIFNVQGSYIVPEFRKRYIRSIINLSIMTVFDRIITMSAQSEESKCFLDNSGYIIDPISGIYVLTKENMLSNFKKRNLFSEVITQYFGEK